MAFSWILFRYLALRLVIGMAVVGGCLTALIFLIDFVELLRTFAAKSDVPFSALLGLSLMKTPYLMEQVLPFVVLFGAILTFMQLTRNSELIVVRASGVSVWQFLAPSLTVALLFGIFIVTIYNPMSSTLYSQYEEQKSRYVSTNSSFLKVSPDGIWLRQGNADTLVVIHALNVKDRAAILEDVIVFRFAKAENENDEGEYELEWVSRVDAERATLEKGYWSVTNANVTIKEQPAVFEAETRIETYLTKEQIQDSFASPDTISFWNLPQFIRLAEGAGFSAVPHRLHWHRVFSVPMLLCAMVLIAASFSLRLTRLGGVGKLILAGVLFGFFLYFASDVTRALGLSGNLPVIWAAWAPTVIAMLLGLATLFHLEDG